LGGKGLVEGWWECRWVVQAGGGGGERQRAYAALEWSFCFQRASAPSLPLESRGDGSTTQARSTYISREVPSYVCVSWPPGYRRWIPFQGYVCAAIAAEQLSRGWVFERALSQCVRAGLAFAVCEAARASWEPRHRALHTRAGDDGGGRMRRGDAAGPARRRRRRPASGMDAAGTRADDGTGT